MRARPLKKLADPIRCTLATGKFDSVDTWPESCSEVQIMVNLVSDKSDTTQVVLLPTIREKLAGKIVKLFNKYADTVTIYTSREWNGTRCELEIDYSKDGQLRRNVLLLFKEIDFRGSEGIISVWYRPTADQQIYTDSLDRGIDEAVRAINDLDSGYQK